MTHIETHATEGSSYVITVATNFTPTAMTWRLTDEDGTVINSRSTVSVTSPSTSNVITLTGDDLDVTNAKKVLRIFTCKGTYNGGANTFADECTFYVDNLKGVT